MSQQAIELKALIEQDLSDVVGISNTSPLAITVLRV